jgi:hypothetical protein
MDGLESAGVEDALKRGPRYAADFAAMEAAPKAALAFAAINHMACDVTPRTFVGIAQLHGVALSDATQ